MDDGKNGGRGGNVAHDGCWMNATNTSGDGDTVQLAGSFPIVLE